VTGELSGMPIIWSVVVQGNSIEHTYAFGSLSHDPFLVFLLGLASSALSFELRLPLLLQLSIRLHLPSSSFDGKPPPPASPAHGGDHPPSVPPVPPLTSSMADGKKFPKL
jgi:hypothetical protein